MTNRNILIQEQESYQAQMGKYDAAATYFNETLDKAKAGTATLVESNGYYYLSDKASGDGLAMRTDNSPYAAVDHMVGSTPPGPGAVQEPQTGVVEINPIPIYSGSYYDESSGKYLPTITGYEKAYTTVPEGQGLLFQYSETAPHADGQSGTVRGGYDLFPILPTAPDIANYGGAEPPSLTRSEERVLNDEKTYAQYDATNKTQLDKVKDSTAWSPFADSGKSLLTRVLQDKL